MKEIGGYIEFEHYKGDLYHDNALKLNSGRSCLEYIIRHRNIKKIALPYLMCDSVIDICKKMGIEIIYYHIDKNYNPIYNRKNDEEWLYLMNYYGQLNRETIEKLFEINNHKVILDCAQDYFFKPIDNMDTIYTCRKFLGVPDGAFLYTNLERIEYENDYSYQRYNFLLGRHEKTAKEFYSSYVLNNKIFKDEGIKNMSKLTENILRSFDYKNIKEKRTKNFAYLSENLKAINQLELENVEGAFAYPLMIKNGSEIRKKLIEMNIYIPVLWPNVLEEDDIFDYEYNMVNDLMPIPCDQRYDVEDMSYMIREIKKLIKQYDV